MTDSRVTGPPAGAALGEAAAPAPGVATAPSCDAPTAGSPATAQAPRFPAAAAGVLAAGIFLVLFDSLAVATALPTIAADLGVGAAQVQWVVTLNALSIGAVLVLGGRIADRYGRRRVLVASLALLTAATVLAGLAQSLAVLLAGRVLQGIAAAFALPASLAMAGSVFRDEPWCSRVFAVISVSAGTAGLAGAVCGGLLTTGLGWRWVFLATVPPSLVAVVAALAFLPANRNPRAASERLDALGATGLTVVLVLLIFGLGRVAPSGVVAPDVILPVTAAIALLAALVRHQRTLARRRRRDDQEALRLVRKVRGRGRRKVAAALAHWRRTKGPQPFLPLRLLRRRPVLGGCLATAANSATYMAVVIVGSLHLQEVHDLSAAQAGLALAPSLLGTSLAGFAAAALVRRFGSRLLAAAGLCLGAISMVMLAAGAGEGTPLLVIVAWFFVRGVSGGLTYVALTREAIGEARETERSAASGVFEATTHVAGAAAVALYVTLGTSVVGYSGAYLLGGAFAVAGAVAAAALLPAWRPTASVPAAQGAGDG